MKNAINWFEIQAVDFKRAVKFYNTILDAEMPETEMGGHNMAFFPCDEGGVGGAIIANCGRTPSPDGTLVYLNAQPDLSIALAKIEPAGGKVLVPKTFIKEDIGYFAIFLDTEGNEVALHSMS